MLKIYKKIEYHCSLVKGLRSGTHNAIRINQLLIILVLIKLIKLNTPKLKFNGI